MSRKVLPIQEYHADEALKGLNRITGLDFQRWPESLLPPRMARPESPEPAPEVEQRTAEYLYQAWRSTRTG